MVFNLSKIAHFIKLSTVETSEDALSAAWKKVVDAGLPKSMDEFLGYLESEPESERQRFMDTFDTLLAILKSRGWIDDYESLTMVVIV